ncbi:hypothetical protein JCM11251_003639 [Rhodosporidiobolus azoricus]
MIVRSANPNHAVNQAGHAQLSDVQRMLDAFIANKAINTGDSVQIALINTDWHRSRSDSRPHLQVTFFEIVNDKFHVQMWRDATGHLQGERSDVHIYQVPDWLGYNVPCWVPSSQVPCDLSPEVKKTRIPGTNWFLEDHARFIPFKTLEDEWNGIARN